MRRCNFKRNVSRDETKGAAERRQNIATAEGRGFPLRKAKPRQGRKIFKRDSAQPSKIGFRDKCLSTAFSRGYVLVPLRG